MRRWPGEKLNLLRRLVVDYAEHNAHMYCIILPSADMRTKLIDDLQEDDISAYMHYVPLHSSPLGLKRQQAGGLSADGRLAAFASLADARLLVRGRCCVCL